MLPQLDARGKLAQHGHGSAAGGRDDVMRESRQQPVRRGIVLELPEIERVQLCSHRTSEPFVDGVRFT